MGSSVDRIAAWQWPKGTSGNPKGRPRKRPLTGEYENVLASEAPAEVVRALARFGAHPHDTWSKCIALSQARNALMNSAGSTLAAKEMREACEGKATRRLEVMAADERTISITVEYEEPRLSRPILDNRVPGARIIDADVIPEPSDTASTREPSE